MQVIAGRKLLTCRYWAFDPRCPNIDASGVDTCNYAHWDTGNLSNFYQQRGTCWYWLIPSSDVGGAQPATSSIERRDTWASTMAVSWPGMPLANLFVHFLARYLLKLAHPYIHLYVTLTLVTQQCSNCQASTSKSQMPPANLASILVIT